MKKRLEIIQHKLEQLTNQDKELKIFGASQYAKIDNGHKYKLHPPISLEDILAFEQEHQLKLPLEYRLYLTELANGGTGPYYGLYSLEKGMEEAEDYSTEEKESIPNPYAEPFPFSTKETKKFIKYYNNCLEDGNDDGIQYLDIPNKLTGVIFLSDYGCGWSYFLVVNGEQAGTVWLHGEYLCPLFVENKQWSFFDWYEDWLDRSLLELNPVEDPKSIGKENTILNYDGWKLKKVPIEVFENKNLKKFVFSRNDLPCFPNEILTLKELKVLDLSMTPIIDIPEEIAALSALKELKLNYNHHTKLPDSLCTLKHLVDLSMFYNYDLTEIPEVVGKTKSLKKLHFSHCSKLTKLYDNIGELINLQTLDLNECALLSLLPESIGNLKKLKHLFLGRTSISVLPKSIQQLSNLEVLGIDIELLDLNDAVEKIKNLPKLHTLYIMNQLDFPDSFAELTSIKTIVVKQNYHLRRNGYYNLPLPENISLIENLECLELSNNNQLNALPENIGRLKKLQLLSFYATSIQYLPDSMQHLKELNKIQASLNTDINSPFGLFPKEKEKLVNWHPEAKVWIW